jgi:hypothetical protein
MAFLARNAPRFAQAVDVSGAAAAGQAAGLEGAEMDVARALRKRAELRATAAGDSGSDKARAKLQSQVRGVALCLCCSASGLSPNGTHASPHFVNAGPENAH